MISLISIGIWIGLLIGLSFTEAPLKFLAPNMTLELGLGIGKLVFSALNKMEIILCSVLILSITKNNLSQSYVLLLSILIVLVACQSLWLLPALNKRVDAILLGTHIIKSYHHMLYVGMEVTKLICLPTLFYHIYFNK